MVNIPSVSPPLDEVTTALLELFDLSGRTVAGGQGFDAAFDGNPVTPAYPYWILFQIAGGFTDPFPDLDLDLSSATATWQLTAVSNYRNQAQQLARVCRDLILGRTERDWIYPVAAPDGWQIITRRPDAIPAGVIRTGEPPTAIFSAPLRFTLTIAPV